MSPARSVLDVDWLALCRRSVDGLREVLAEFPSIDERAVETGERGSGGGGAFLNGSRLDPEVGERRTRDGRLEILGIKSADPRWVAASIDPLVGSAHRLRALGTIAATLCQVAAGRMDGMVTLRKARGIDGAAAQLIVREGGGHVSFTAYEDRLAAPLDAVPRSPVVAARTPETAAALERIPT
jgi:myo-inositol-1(or 4)-monophosphatase